MSAFPSLYATSKHNVPEKGLIEVPLVWASSLTMAGPTILQNQTIIDGIHPQSHQLSLLPENQSMGLPQATTNPSIIKSRHRETFPVKLHAILSASDSLGIIEWRPHGQAFKIRNVSAFVKQVLPSFTNGSTIADHLTSFIRILKIWGFRQFSKHSSPDVGAFYHECFVRGNPDLCLQMSPIREERSRPQFHAPHLDPDFYRAGVLSSTVGRAILGGLSHPSTLVVDLMMARQLTNAAILPTTTPPFFTKSLSSRASTLNSPMRTCDNATAETKITMSSAEEEESTRSTRSRHTAKNKKKAGAAATKKSPKKKRKPSKWLPSLGPPSTCCVCPPKSLDRMESEWFCRNPELFNKE